MSTSVKNFNCDEFYFKIPTGYKNMRQRQKKIGVGTLITPISVSQELQF